jgi:hypothetical protein
VRLAFYKGKGKLLNKIIRWRTKSKYSHVELEVLPGICWSSSWRDGGVRFKNIDLENANWDCVPLRHVKSVDVNEIIKWCQKLVGARYGVKDVFKFMIPFLRSRRNEWFCSEACLAALQSQFYYLGHRPDKTSPGKLHEIVTKG